MGLYVEHAHDYSFTIYYSNNKEYTCDFTPVTELTKL